MYKFVCTLILLTYSGYSYSQDNYIAKNENIYIENINIPYLIDISHSNIIVINTPKQKITTIDSLIYVYDNRGKLIKKFGSYGQAPGDLMLPVNIKTDELGNIYIYDDWLKRMTVYDRNGKVKTVFKVQGNNTTSYIISNGNIYINLPNTGYCITKYLLNGQKSSSYIKIKKYNSNENLNYVFNEGSIILTEDYKLFLLCDYIMTVKICNSLNKKEEYIEKSYSDIIKYFAVPDNYINPEKQDVIGRSFRDIIGSILNYKNKYYIVIDRNYIKYNDINEYTAGIILEFNKDLTFNKLITIKREKEVKNTFISNIKVINDFIVFTLYNDNKIYLLK